MAAGLSIISEGGKYNGGMTMLVVMSCFMAAIGGVLFGYDLGISGLFHYDRLDTFPEEFADQYSPAAHKNSGVLVTRAFGRKPSILVGGASFLAGSALGVPLYISEMALPRHRGAMNIGFEVGVGFGVLVANLVNFGTEKIKGGWGWPISLAVAAVPAAIVTLSTLNTQQLNPAKQ
ncbi:Major facilitator [Theobroma cacao]|nr:Major facilitator [Theobroma cacao]